MNRRRWLPVLLIALLGVAAAVIFFLRTPQPAVEPPLLDVAHAQHPPAGAARAGDDTHATSPPARPVREEAAGAPQGEITGRVLSTETREGIEGAEVTWSSARGAFSTRSGAAGLFTFRPPEAGAYQLASAKADRFLPFGPEWGKSPVAVTFRPGQRVSGVTVELTPAPEILGRVVDATGQPAPQASVRILVPRKEALFPMRDRFTTDAKGEVRFEAAPYAVVEAFHPTLGSGSERLEAGVRELVITLEPHAADAGTRVALKGRVVHDGEPAPGALVHAASALSIFPRTFGSSEGYRELTDADGRFEIAELQPGTYDVSAHLLGTAPAHRFDVAVPAKEELVLELGSGPKLSGRVTDEGGEPVPAFELTVHWRKAPLERLTVVEAGFVDPDGRYLVEGIADGDYELELRSAGFVTATRRVSVKGDTRADVTLMRGLRVTGVVREADSRQPIPGAKVALEGTDRATVTAADGTFVLEGMSPAGFSLQASAEGHNTRVVGVSQPSAPVELELTKVAPDAGPKTELAGIGLVLRGRGDALVVGEVMPGGGAAAAGIVTGDEITSVDGHVVAELGFEPAIRAIRGPVGSQVELALRRGEKSVMVVAVRKKITN